ALRVAHAGSDRQDRALPDRALRHALLEGTARLVEGACPGRRCDRPWGHEPDDPHRRSRRSGGHGDPAAARPGRRAPRANRRAQGGRQIAPLDFFFLTDGGQNADAIAQRLASFLDGATKTLDVAIYELRLVMSLSSMVFICFQLSVKLILMFRFIFI